jgi:hypothetical protein
VSCAARETVGGNQTPGRAEGGRASEGRVAWRQLTVLSSWAGGFGCEGGRSGALAYKRVSDLRCSPSPSSRTRVRRRSGLPSRSGPRSTDPPGRDSATPLKVHESCKRGSHIPRPAGPRSGRRIPRRRPKRGQTRLSRAERGGDERRPW